MAIGDLLKSVSGDMNLNSALDINMMMILGAYRFCISNAAYQSLSRSTEYNWAEQERLGAGPALQFVGAGPEKISLHGEIYPHFKGGLRQVTLMRAEAGLGIPLMLISGNGMAFGRWCITSISEDQTYFLKDGTARKISFSITLQKYGEETQAGALGIVQQVVGAL